MNPDAAAPPSTPSTPSVDPRLAAHLDALARHVAGFTNPPPLPDIATDVRQVWPQDDLPARFAATAAAAGMSVHRATVTEWIQRVLAVLRDAAVKSAFVAAHSGSALTSERVAQLAGALQASGIEVKSTPDDDTLFRVDVGITGVVAAVAETGTIVCTSGPGLARGSSLIPPLHVAVVDADQIVPDLYDFFAALAPAGALPANFTLITGPSKTADIEGILITGVHGPRAVHVVLVGS